MKAMKTMVAVLAAAVAVSAWGADRPEGERLALKAAFENAQKGLAESPIPADVPVALLPIRGDADGWLEGLAKDALVGAGKICVVGKDDPILKDIIDEMEWDERKSDILDAATLDLITAKKLLSAKILMTATVETSERNARRWNAEVTLRAVEIATKRYLWTGRFDESVPDDGRWHGKDVSEIPCPLNVGVKVAPEKGAEAVGELLGTYARGRLADMGCRAGSGKDDDLTLDLDVTCRLYDQTLNWWMHEGELTAALKVHGGDARLLGETSIAAQGARGRGEIQSQRNLADELGAQLLGWMGRVLASDALGFAAIRLDFTLANPIEEKEDYKAIDEIQKGLAGLPGVRSAEVVDQDNGRGRVSLKVVYDSKLLPTGPWNKLLAEHPELLEKYLR